MAIVFTGSKTVTTSLAPHLSAAALTTLLAKAPETMTIKDVHVLNDALNRVAAGDDTKTVGSLLL